MLGEYIHEHYKEGEPFFTEDIHIPGMKKANLNQQLKTFSDQGVICRYDKGIYYMPRKGVLKAASGPTSDEVASKKYIQRNGEVMGYYSGGTFANQIGISLQVPSKVEIVSNRMAAIVREISLGRRTYIVRNAKVPVTKENAPVLQILDLLKNLSAYTDDDDSETRTKLGTYIKQNKITKEDVDQYIRAFPDSTFRFYYEMGLDDVLA